MDKCDLLKLIKLPNYIFLDILVSGTIPTIGLHNGHTELSDERFIAVGLEKSKAAQGYEGTDYFNVCRL